MTRDDRVPPQFNGLSFDWRLLMQGGSVALVRTSEDVTIPPADVMLVCKSSPSMRWMAKAIEEDKQVEHYLVLLPNNTVEYYVDGKLVMRQSLVDGDLEGTEFAPEFEIVNERLDAAGLFQQGVDRRTGRHVVRFLDPSHTELLRVDGLIGEIESGGNMLRVHSTKRSWSATMKIAGSGTYTIGIRWGVVEGRYQPSGMHALPDDPLDLLLDQPEFRESSQVVE